MQKDIVFSIIMPTYEDEKTISASIESIARQTEQKWELIISDDASPDNTENIVKTHARKDSRIRYIKSKENGDQLNAILRVRELIRGKYVFILHSDDMFANNTVLEKAKNKLDYTDLDAIVADLELIDEKSNSIGRQKVTAPSDKRKSGSLTLLWLGRNPYVDFAFFKKDAFLKAVTDNYLEWNTPFWLDSKSGEILKVEKVDFPFIKYRVHKENYKNNDIGKFCVLNGELRTATNLMRFYRIPNYCGQYYVFRTANKLNLDFSPLAINGPTPIREQYKIIKFIIEKTYTEKDSLPQFLKEYMAFFEYHLRKHIPKTLDLRKCSFPNDFKGKDIRLFARQMFEKKLDEGYEKIICALKDGFDDIICSNKHDKNKIENFIRLINIQNVGISIKIGKKAKDERRSKTIE